MLLIFTGFIFVISTAGLIVMVMLLLGMEPLPLLENLLISAVWFSSVMALRAVYKMKGLWLLQVGIYQSWGNFKAYAVYPTLNKPVTSTWDFTELFDSTNLDKGKRLNLKTAKSVYKEIQNKYSTENYPADKYRDLVDSLLSRYIIDNYQPR